jgi:hypothetical protein
MLPEPEIIASDDNRFITYFLGDKIHRIGGPARINANRRFSSYWVDGKRYGHQPLSLEETLRYVKAVQEFIKEHS